MNRLNEVSLSTTIKNRLWLFKQALPTWIKYPFKNILILNWNSDDTEELHEYVESFKDDRIILIDVTGKRTVYFRAPISRNLAAERCLELTKPKFLFQIDCDIKINDSILDLKLEDDLLYVSEHARFMLNPEWEQYDENAENFYENIEEIEVGRRQRGTIGSHIIPANKVFQYGYYNENFIENNLFDMYYLAKFLHPDNSEKVAYFKDEVEHIDHDTESRVVEGTEHTLRRAMMVNYVLKDIAPYRYPFTIVDERNVIVN